MRILSTQKIAFLLIIITCSILIPIFVHAAVNAGVVNGIWFSKSNPQAGETISIFTAVQNQSARPVVGSVGFLVNGDIVGTKKFSVKSNDVVPVSIEYTFLGGKHEVSAYITSVEDESVAYTVVQKTSVSIPSSQKARNESAPKNVVSTSSTSGVLKTLEKTTKNITTSIDPITENVAERIEEFRDSLLVAEDNSTGDTTMLVTENEEDKTKVEIAKDFLKGSKTIATNPDINLWKKVVGVLLSLLALLVRLWFVFVILLAVFIFWRLVRGQRIR